MIDIGDKVRTVNKITQKEYDTLKRNNIRPGTLGEIEEVLVVVNFKGVKLILNESSVEYVTQKRTTNESDDSTLDNLQKMFGFK